jgi:hypothetical protein
LQTDKNIDKRVQDPKKKKKKKKKRGAKLGNVGK